jgi:hypothetical protein
MPFRAHRGIVPERKMQSRIVARDRSWIDSRCSGAAFFHHNAPEPALRSCFDQTSLSRVSLVFPADIVTEKRRPFVPIDHEHVSVALMVTISDGASAALRLRHTWAGRLYQLLKQLFPELRNTAQEGSCSHTEEAFVR